MLSKHEDLHLKLAEMETTDINYLIRVLELTNKDHEDMLKTYKVMLTTLEKRNDKYAIKQCNWKINLYEKMLEKNNQLISKLQ